jgi:F-type H+-transporting ATPase subunit b
MFYIFAVSFGEVLGDVAARIFPSIPALVSQLIATTILVLVVRRYFWKSAVEYMEKRKKYVHQVVTDAQTLKSQAEANVAKTEKELNGAYLNARKIIDEAKAKADAEKDANIAAANKDSDFKRDQIKRELENERAKADKEIKQQIIEVAMNAAEKVSQRKITDHDTEKLVNDFVKGN